jgi:pyridinium-3,5-bisthiocarboxylic acid mononucleotide nickel chelatase
LKPKLRALYLDCFAGISGDMMVGALLDLGLELETLEQELRKMPISGFELSAFPVNKNGIRATQFQVSLLETGGKRIADSEFSEVGHQEDHHPEAAGSGFHQEGPHPHRHLSEILAIIAQSSLSESVKTTATAIFNRLGEAEANVHGMPLENVHLHEVGGIDAIVDIVGTVIGIEQLGIEEIYASPLPLGSGFVRSAHGMLPVPAPATAALLQDVPVYSGPGPGELVTPTGAAIVTTLAKGFGPMPQMWLTGVGYGSGTRQRNYPNVLRAFLGEVNNPDSQARITAIPGRDPYPEQHAGQPVAAGYHESPAVLIEANLDDMNPQFYEPLVSHLLEAGALDATLIPVQMKKGRPGVLLQVLAYPTSLDEMLAIIFTESTTIGARSYPVIKHMLQRESQLVETPYGAVQVKIARLGERIVTVAPEFEDCRRLADQHQVPVKEIHALALSAYHLKSTPAKE